MGMVYPQKSREQAIEEVRKNKPHLTEGELQAAADKALARLEQRRKNKRLRSERAESQRPAEKQDDLDETFDCLDDLDCRDAGGRMISIVEMLEIALSHDVSDTPRPCDGNSDDSYGSPRSYGSFLSDSSLGLHVYATFEGGCKESSGDTSEYSRASSEYSPTSVTASPSRSADSPSPVELNLAGSVDSLHSTLSSRGQQLAMPPDQQMELNIFLADIQRAKENYEMRREYAISEGKQWYRSLSCDSSSLALSDTALDDMAGKYRSL